ncbi:MAG: hypothetical protein IOD12_09035 [Silvanigrellales bacterium]|nr:hypothetical protein [Silvanigrellales bacterium]
MDTTPPPATAPFEVASSQEAMAATAPPLKELDESVSSLFQYEAHGTWQVALPFKFSALDGRSAWLAGGRLGLLKKERHVLSFAYFQKGGGAAPKPNSFYERLDFRYGGLVLGWEANGLALFQSYAHTLVGVGSGSLKEREESGGRRRRTKPLVVLEPELGFFWKVTHHVRGSVGVSWRGAWGNSLDPLPRHAFDGWAATLGAAIGTYPTLLPKEPPQ